jgi:hypothetical protein
MKKLELVAATALSVAVLSLSSSAFAETPTCEGSKEVC